MTLLVIVASLMLELFVGRWQHLRRLDWFSFYRHQFIKYLPDSCCIGWKSVVSLLAIPVIILWVLQWAFGSQLWGLFNFLLEVLVVTYCLGPEPFNQKVDEYLRNCEEHHRVEARNIAESLTGEPVSDSFTQQTRAVTTAILYEGNKRIFAVLFWFMLLGAAGALLYRCAAFLAEDEDANSLTDMQSIADKVFVVLDYLPAHLLSLTFLLSGSFEDAWRAWLKAVSSDVETNARSRSVVVITGCGAMRHEISQADDAGEDEQNEEYDLKWVRSARGLVVRSLFIWLAVVALLTMIGLFV